ncbi:GSCFA domain-containing protein, partial [Veillonella nakazawae]|nr:GSCFA domain-containing protein [Veillonella nakazawae]
EQVFYFPAYEIVNDELRDYRFYAPDMLHPSAQAVEYIWERLQQSCFSPALLQFLEAWRPIKEGLAHRPFNPSSLEYQ